MDFLLINIFSFYMLKSWNEFQRIQLFKGGRFMFNIKHPPRKKNTFLWMKINPVISILVKFSDINKFDHWWSKDNGRCRAWIDPPCTKSLPPHPPPCLRPSLHGEPFHSVFAKFLHKFWHQNHCFDTYRYL